MSFANYKSTIDLGDTVILYISNNFYAIEVCYEIKNKRGEMVQNVYQTPVGALKVKDLVGVEYGSRVELSKGWGHVLQPTPELWSLTLPHRTQIIYTPDISMILLQLDLVPGSIVLEAGTGSGSLTHALTRRVKPHGHVYTFDFHEHRANIARLEFESHGISTFVTVQQRDVLQEGFGDKLEYAADAVFLDLPSPWLGVVHASNAIKLIGGRFCSFSPCIEQVQRTCLALQQHGFQDIATMEVLQTELRVNRRTITEREFGFLKYRSSVNPVKEKPSGETSVVVAAWPTNCAGHTGYLCFATLPQRAEPIKEAIQAEIDIETTSSDSRICIEDSDNDCFIIDESPAMELDQLEQANPEIEQHVRTTDQANPKIEQTVALITKQTIQEIEQPVVLTTEQTNPEIEQTVALITKPIIQEIEQPFVLTTEQANPEIQQPAALLTGQTMPEIEQPVALITTEPVEEQKVQEKSEDVTYESDHSDSDDVMIIDETPFIEEPDTE